MKSRSPTSKARISSRSGSPVPAVMDAPELEDPIDSRASECAEEGGSEFVEDEAATGGAASTFVGGSEVEAEDEAASEAWSLGCGWRWEWCDRG